MRGTFHLPCKDVANSGTEPSQMPQPDDQDTSRQGRHLALVIAAAGLLTIFAPMIVQGLGLAPRYEILILLIALAAFFWALVVAFQIWQKTRNK